MLTRKPLNPKPVVSKVGLAAVTSKPRSAMDSAAWTKTRRGAYAAVGTVDDIHPALP